jgi:hypothetical protein
MALAGFVGDRAVAGAGRIDEHQIGEVEPVVRIVDQLGRGLRHLALGTERHDARTERAEMQIGRAGARPPLKTKVIGRRSAFASSRV